eukprot:gene11046-19897_t
MPNGCVVGKCGAVYSDGLSLHKFPKDEKIIKLWVKFVQCTKKDFMKHSVSSCICSLHFNPDCFKKTRLLILLALAKEQMMLGNLHVEEGDKEINAESDVRSTWKDGIIINNINWKTSKGACGDTTIHNNF